MNKINLIGRVSTNIELRYTTNNTSVATFNLAVGRKFKNSQGEYDTDFFSCKAFGKLADLIAKHVKKGDRLGVCGSIYFSKYQAQDGTNRISTQVSINEVEFLEAKKQDNETKKEEDKQDPYNDFGEWLSKGEDYPF